MNRKIFPAVLSLILFVSVSASAQKAQVLTVSKQVVTALKNKDMKTLAAHAHPTKGVRFTPYNYMSESDLIFKKAQIPGLFLTRRSYKWGEFDGTGDPINLGFPAYYKRFVYDRDFAGAKSVSYNQRRGGAGNAVFNGPEVYPNAKYVEYYLPGTKRYDGMDWRSLILVFEKSGAKWYLVAVAHDEWTI
jgi:hypothetical protein